MFTRLIYSSLTVAFISTLGNPSYADTVSCNAGVKNLAGDGPRIYRLEQVKIGWLSSLTIDDFRLALNQLSTTQVSFRLKSGSGFTGRNLVIEMIVADQTPPSEIELNEVVFTNRDTSHRRSLSNSTILRMARKFRSLLVSAQTEGIWIETKLAESSIVAGATATLTSKVCFR